MKRISKSVLASFVLGFLVVGGFLFAKHAQSDMRSNNVPSDIRTKVIYGDDNRVDVYQSNSQMFRDLAQSTVGLFSKYNVTEDPSTGMATIAFEKFADSFRLCESEPFREQPSAAFCSGSLVAEDLIMTAGHCIRSESACQSTKFVFNFAYRTVGDEPTKVPNEDVVSCKKIVARAEFSNGADYAIVKIDRPVKKYRPLAISRSGKIDNGAPLVVIGHPSGIPTKISDGASVRDNSPGGFFVANLDTYGGNSGSAVFNTQTGLIEGILVRGETDFVSNGSCYVSNVCGSNDCRGEDVTKVSEVAKYIPQKKN